jgi:Spy/CpxP family protein refolding chaperone
MGPLADLSDEQRTAYQQAMRDAGQESREIQRQVTQARRELNAATFVDKVDEAVIRAKAEQMAKLEAEVAIIRAKAFAKIASKFTPEQLKRFQEGSAMGPQIQSGRPPSGGPAPGQPPAGAPGRMREGPAPKPGDKPADKPAGAQAK